MSFHSYNMELGAILKRLPLCFYDKGRIGAIRTAYANGFANRLWSREQAVRVCFLANMESAQAHGSGNESRRRAEKMAARRFIQRHAAAEAKIMEQLKDAPPYTREQLEKGPSS